MFVVREIQLESIQFLAQSVGSGKTKAAIEGIRLKDDECHIFVAPTKPLAMEIEERMLKDLVDTPLVNKVELLTEDHPDIRRGEVSATILQRINDLGVKDTHVLIVTTQGFRLALPHMNEWTKSRYNIYLDEGIDAIDYKEIALGEDTPRYSALFDRDEETGFTVIRDEHQKVVANLAARNAKALGKHAGLQHEQFTPFAEMITSGLYDVFTTITKHTIYAAGMIRPQLFAGFKSVTMIVAMFEQSPLAKYWSHSHGIALEEFKHELDLRDTHTEKGSLINVWHAFNEIDNASRTNLEYKIDGVRMIDKVVSIVDDFFKRRDETYVYTINNYKKNHPERNIKNGTRMLTHCQGLNDWRQHNNVVVMSSMLPSPRLRDIVVRLLGEDGNKFYHDWRMAHTYQVVGRGSIRTPENESPITLIVLSAGEAKDLCRIFKGATYCGQLGNLPSIKTLKRNGKPVYTDADNVSYSKYKKRQKEAEEPILSKDQWYEIKRKPQLAKA